MTSVPIDRVIEEVQRTMKRGDIVRTVGMVRQLAMQARQDPRSRHLQAMTALEFGQCNEAVGLLETLVFELTGDALRHATVDLARAREMQGDLEAASVTIRPEIEAEAPFASAIATAARIRFLQGEDAEAVQMLDAVTPEPKRAYEIARARGFMALNTPHDHPDREARERVAIEAISAQAETVGVPASALMPMLIDLGELHARRGEDGQAARAWKRSAGLNPNRVDPRNYAQTVMALVQSWNAKTVGRAQTNQRAPGSDTERPVFVVGLPGAGARVVGAMLAASPEAEVSRDPEALTAAVGRHLAPSAANGQAVVPDPSRLNATQLAAAADMYLARTEPADSGSSRVIDAFELNLHALGVVAQMFPNASVVFVRRDAFDASLACMLAHRDPRLLYSHDPRALTVFAGGIARLTDHWQQIFAGDDLPLRHTVVDYDEIVTDGAARAAMFEAIGLTPPADSDLHGVIEAQQRFTRAQVGLKPRFGSGLAQLAEAAGQIGFDRV